MNKSDISRRLARLMRENGISQSGLSRGASVPQPTINRILNEKTKEPRRESVVRIANFFGVAPESLYQLSNEIRDESDAVERVYDQFKSLRPNQQKEVLRWVMKDLESD
jgi:transcriptional regulator with XRE-family HTH domain